MSHNSIRVRFAPSPTGHLHIGGLRSALFNWLYARRYNGTFLLRIEDTDIERSKDEYTKALLEALEWAGVHSDEPIVIQSERIEIHRKLIHNLLQQGKAYYCTCSADDVIKRLKESGQDILFIKYDGYCRSRNNTHGAVRFKIPENMSDVSFHDLIRGDITVNVAQLDDFIIMRTDGTPMYNFVVVADDAHMNISHVIRGEEHISNTPKQILLYQALEFHIPHFAHLPLILGPDGNKLSKRDAATAVIDYKTAGYLPDALVNYLVRLGWAHGDQEIFSRQEMIASFSLEAVSKKGAIFDQKKLDWMNGYYIRNTDNKTIHTLIERDVDATFVSCVAQWTSEQINSLIELYKQRSHTLKELAYHIINFSQDPDTYITADVMQWTSAQTPSQLQELVSFLQGYAGSLSELEQAIKQWSKERGIKLVAIAQPVRIALLGNSSGPGVFDLIAILGINKTIIRINKFIQFLQNEIRVQS